MAGSLNKIMLIGNLGKDPELKATPSGEPVTRISIATKETWKDKNGEKQDRTEWHNVVIWGKRAEFVEKYARKGNLVFVEGRMQYREYTDKDGVKKNIAEVRCDDIKILERKQDGGEERDSRPANNSAPASGSSSDSNFDDDIPF